MTNKGKVQFPVVNKEFIPGKKREQSVTNKEFILEKKERTACVLISNCAFALVNGLVIRDGRRPGSGWMC
jgi:uncharacterized protein YuzB (UPF0349 family)